MDEDSQKQVYKDEATQKMLNEPVKDDQGISAEDRTFLELVINKINDGSIELYSPSSLLNDSYYQTLGDDKKGLADLETMNMLTKIRNIKDLYDAGFTETFQMVNLVHSLRESKERLEQEAGDLFII
jgi:hypothetical protein